MDLPEFPPISDALIKAMNARWPDALPRIVGDDYAHADLQAAGAVVLRNMGRRDVVEGLILEQQKQRLKE